MTAGQDAKYPCGLDIQPSQFLAGEERAVEAVRSWIRSQLVKQLRMIPLDYLEDIEQDILLDLLNDLDEGRFRGDSRFETYVRSYARFRAIDYLRAKGRRQFVPLDESEAVALPSLVAASPAVQLLDSETREQLESLLDNLGDDCRRLWVMLVDGLSYDEMADSLGVRAATLRVRMHRCRERAQEKWREFHPDR